MQKPEQAKPAKAEEEVPNRQAGKPMGEEAKHGQGSNALEKSPERLQSGPALDPGKVGNPTPADSPTYDSTSTAAAPSAAKPGESPPVPRHDIPTDNQGAGIAKLVIGLVVPIGVPPKFDRRPGSPVATGRTLTNAGPILIGDPVRSSAVLEGGASTKVRRRQRQGPKCE
jgi:hypothetical protein